MLCVVHIFSTAKIPGLEEDTQQVAFWCMQCCGYSNNHFEALYYVTVKMTGRLYVYLDYVFAEKISEKVDFHCAGVTIFVFFGLSR